MRKSRCRGEARPTIRDYRGTPQEFISAVKYGYLFQGQWYRWQKKRRGTPALDLPPAAFINYIQNHDQVANSIRGERCHAFSSPACYRAMTALLLLAPGTPMLFQGQEFASSRPFCYFADLSPGLRALTRAGRAKFLSQFPSLRSADAQACLADPADPKTFEGCKLDFSERTTHAGNLCLAPRPFAIAARRPCNRPAAARRRGRSSPRRRGVRAALLRDGRRRPGAHRQSWAWTCTSARRPNRCWPRRKDVAGSCGGRAKIPPTEVPGFVRWKPMRSGRSRGTPPGDDSRRIRQAPRTSQMQLDGTSGRQV